MSLRPLTVLAGALVLAALVGCTTTTAPTTDPSPTAVVPSNDELVEQFADALCPAVIAEEAFADVWLNQNSTLEEIVAVAVTARDEDTVTAEAIVAFTDSWPEEFHADLALVEDLYTGKSADYAQIAEATSLAPLTTFEFGDVTDGNAAAKRVVDALGTESIDCG